MSDQKVQIKCGDVAAKVLDAIEAEAAAESETPIADEVNQKLLPHELWCQHGIRYERGDGDTYACTDPDAVGHPKTPTPVGQVPCQPLTPYDATGYSTRLPGTAATHLPSAPLPISRD